MSIKKLLTIVLSLMLTASAAAFVACDYTIDDSSSCAQIEYVGFDVPATAEAAYGTTYTLPEFTVTDKDDNVYSVDVEVTCDGAAVAIVAGKIELTELKTYVIKYTITGTDVTKTLTLTVKDGVKPTVIIGETKAWYFVGEEITLPEVSVTDNLDSDLAYEMSVYSGEAPVAEKVSGKITLSAQGRYILKATAKDSAGNVGENQVEIIVRSAAKKGEIVDIDSELIADTVTAWNNNDSSLITKEFVEFKGKKALRINSKGGAEAVKYPGVAIVPAITKAQAEELKASGFSYIAVEYYIDYTAARNIYEKWSGKQYSYATELGKWATRTLPLDSFIANYDALASGTTSFFYLGNDEAYTADKTRADFNFYISSIYVCKDVTDVALTGVEDEVEKGYELNVNDLSAASSTEAEATFAVEVYGRNGEKLTADDNGIIVLSESGAYTLKAVSLFGCYKTTAEKTFKVLSDASEVNALISEILAAEDMSTMTEKAEILKNCYAALTDEEKAEIDISDYYAAISLNADRNVKFYFASATGKEQISLAANVGGTDTELATKKYVTLDTSVKYGDQPASTKIAFADLNEGKETWPCPFIVRLNAPANIDASSRYVRFFIQGYSSIAGRPISYSVTVNGKRIAPNVIPGDAPNGEWKEVLVPVEAFVSGKKVAIVIYTHNGNNSYGSVWNNPSKMYVYLSQGEGYNPEAEQTTDVVFEQTEANLGSVRIFTGGLKTAAAEASRSISGDVYYGEEGSSLKYVTANNSSYVEYINFNKNIDKYAYDSFVVRVMIAESSALAKKTQIGYVIYVGEKRVIDLRHNFLKVGVWNEIVVPASLVDSVENLNIGFVVNKWGSAYEKSAEFYFSDLVGVRNGILKAEPVAYGSDYSRVYTDTVGGKTATVLETDVKQGSASNAWKYPGVKVYGLTLDYLKAVKKAGFKTLKVEVYVKDGSQAKQIVKWGKNGNTTISEINTNEWSEISLDIDFLIENFNTYFTNAGFDSAYLFYADNNAYGNSAAYISLCVGGAYFAK